MIPAAFDYVAPQSLADALATLDERGEGAKLLAGGHSLIPLMKLRLAQPESLIDLRRVPGLSFIRPHGAGVAIGAMTTHHELETSDLLRAAMPLVPEVAAVIGDPQVRRRGTIGGSVAHADPGADLPAAVLALQTELVLVGRSGSRTVPGADFFLGMFTTALAAGEILTEIRLQPPAGRAAYAYEKAPNPASGYALAGVAVAIGFAADGVVQEAHIGVTGAGAAPIAATDAAAVLTGSPLGDGTVEEAAALAARAIEDPLDDLHASAAYRRHLVAVLARRALHRLR